MKTIHKLLVLLLILTTSCSTNLEFIEQEIVDGKVSALVPGVNALYVYREPVVYIQNQTKTVSVRIPFEYENRWKIS